MTKRDFIKTLKYKIEHCKPTVALCSPISKTILLYRRERIARKRVIMREMERVANLVYKTRNDCP